MRYLCRHERDQWCSNGQHGGDCYPFNAQAKLPEIHLKDIGKEKGGLSPNEAFKQVLASLYGGITSPAVIGSLNKELKATGSDVLELGKNTSKKGLAETSRKIKGLFGK